MLKTVVVPEMSGDSEVQASLTAEEFEQTAGMTETAAQAFFAQFSQAVEEGRREDAAAMIAWPRLVTTAGGEEITVNSAEEFLPLYEEVFTPGLLEELLENQHTKDRADLIPHDGMVALAGGAVWFAALEDGALAVLVVQSTEGGSLGYDGPAGVTAG